MATFHRWISIAIEKIFVLNKTFTNLFFADVSQLSKFKTRIEKNQIAKFTEKRKLYLKRVISHRPKPLNFYIFSMKKHGHISSKIQSVKALWKKEETRKSGKTTVKRHFLPTQSKGRERAMGRIIKCYKFDIYSIYYKSKWNKISFRLWFCSQHLPFESKNRYKPERQL